MTTAQIRKAFLDFMAKKEHAIIPRANLVPQNDPTTLFTGSGMQPLVQYLLGEEHPQGKRVANSQTCLRAEDIEEVGDMCHTTFFEMLGNWVFGATSEQDELDWLFFFLTEEIKLDPNKLYVTCFGGDKTADVPADGDSARKWSELFATKGVGNKIVKLGSCENASEIGMQNGRIFYYDASKNWWSRAGEPKDMPVGEPGGPDSEIFYDFGLKQHDKEKHGEHCHPNCECGRFLEIGNSVFMQYIKRADNSFGPLPKHNIDFGGGLERIAAARDNNPDMFKIDVLRPIIEKIQQISGKKYDEHTHAMRVIADHMRASTFLAVDGVVPSNKMQGYVMRRMLRRAIRYAYDLGVVQGICHQVIAKVIDIYKNDFPELATNSEQIINVISKEEDIFRQALKKGLKELIDSYEKGYWVKLPEAYETNIATEEEKKQKMGRFRPAKQPIIGQLIFKMYDTYGFPTELTIEEVNKNGWELDKNWESEFEEIMDAQRKQSQTAAKGAFKGGLADASETTTKYHTAAHLLMAALRQVLGDHVEQKGSNITAERLRLDFSHSEKVTKEQLEKVEKIVNQKIKADLPVTCQEQNTKDAIASGAQGVFGHKYGGKVKVYEIGDFSKEICGGPHVEKTGQLGEGGKKFKIKKEESSSAGVRRIKAVLV